MLEIPGERLGDRRLGLWSPVADKGCVQPIVILLGPAGPIRRLLEVRCEYRIAPHQLFELLINILLPIRRNGRQAAIVYVKVVERRGAFQHPAAGDKAFGFSPVGFQVLAEFPWRFTPETYLV